MSENENKRLFELLEVFARQSDEGEYGISSVQFTDHEPKKVLKDMRVLTKSGLLEEKNTFFGDGTQDIYAISDQGYRLYRSLLEQGKEEIVWENVNQNFGNFRYSDVKIDNSGHMSANFGHGGAHQTFNATVDDVKIDYSKLQELISDALGHAEAIEDEDDKADAISELQKLDKAAKEGKTDRFFKISSNVLDLSGKLADIAPKFVAATTLIFKAAGLI